MMSIADFQRMAWTFKHMGLEDPPKLGSVLRARATTHPIPIKQLEEGAPDVMATNLGHGLWTYYVPRRGLTEEEKDQANQDFKARKRR